MTYAYLHCNPIYSYIIQHDLNDFRAEIHERFTHCEMSYYNSSQLTAVKYIYDAISDSDSEMELSNCRLFTVL